LCNSQQRNDLTECDLGKMGRWGFTQRSVVEMSTAIVKLFLGSVAERLRVEENPEEYRGSLTHFLRSGFFAIRVDFFEFRFLR
jgi:hypothetical protein